MSQSGEIHELRCSICHTIYGQSSEAKDFVCSFCLSDAENLRWVSDTNNQFLDRQKWWKVFEAANPNHGVHRRFQQRANETREARDALNWLFRICGYKEENE